MNVRMSASARMSVRLSATTCVSISERRCVRMSVAITSVCQKAVHPSQGNVDGHGQTQLPHDVGDVTHHHHADCVKVGVTLGILLMVVMVIVVMVVMVVMIIVVMLMVVVMVYW